MNKSTAPSPGSIVIRMVMGYFVMFAVGLILVSTVPAFKPIYADDRVFDDSASKFLLDVGVLILFVWYSVMVARLWKARGGNVVAAVLIAVVVAAVTLPWLPSTVALLGPVVSLIVGLLLRSAEGNTRTCPFCAEYIKIEANVCRYCRGNVSSLSA